MQTKSPLQIFASRRAVRPVARPPSPRRWLWSTATRSGK